MSIAYRGFAVAAGPRTVAKAGSRLPAYCIALGKVLLAHIPEHKRREMLSRLDLKRRVRTRS